MFIRSFVHLPNPWFLTSSQQQHGTERSAPPMNFMQNNQSPSIENSQTPSFFPTCHNHHQLFLCKIMNPPPQKILKLFLQCHETILSCFIGLLIVLVVQKLLPMMKLKCNFHNFLSKLGQKISLQRKEERILQKREHKFTFQLKMKERK